jgi:hypothetical protein
LFAHAVQVIGLDNLAILRVAAAKGEAKRVAPYRSRRGSKKHNGGSTGTAVDVKPQGAKFYIPLVHFLAVASHCMPAFLQAASFFGVPANAGAVKPRQGSRRELKLTLSLIVSSDLTTREANQHKTAPPR